MRKQKKKAVSGLALNSTAAAPATTKTTLQHFTFNAKTKLVRNDTMEGRSWKVVPMVMIVEGVLNGSQGPLYYPADELAKTPAVWNHKPVVVYHPTINGKGVSACAPDVLTKHKIGVIMNTKFDKLNRLTAEAWIDEDRANVVDARIMAAVTNGEQMELSTGVFTDNEEAPGDFEGTPYTHIARNYRPDHLAVLPDQIGACSIADGAGFIRNAAAKKVSIPEALSDFLGSAVLATLRTAGIADITANEMSMDNARTQLYGLLRTKLVPLKTVEYVDIWVCDVYAAFCVYSYAGKLFKQGYTTSGTKVELEGEPSEVVRVTEYRTADGSFVGNQNQKQQQQQKVTMNKKDVVDGLISNTSSGWKETDRDFLMGLPEDRLQVIATNAKTVAPAPAKAPIVEPAPAPAANAKPRLEDVLTANQIAAMNYGEQQLAARKAGLVKTITGNAANRFSAEQLNGMEINALESIAALAATPTPAANATPPAATPWFGGLGHAVPAGATTNADKDQGPLTLPTMNFGPEAK